MAEEIGQGAFRRAPLQALCGCGEPASKRCARCDAPLCRDHAPALAHRCADCEDTYASLCEDRRIHPLTRLQLLVSYLAGIAAVVGAALAIDHLKLGAETTLGVGIGALQLSHLLMLLVAIPACVLPALVIHWRRIRLRGAFLAERPDRRRLRAAPRPARITGEQKPVPTVGDSFATAGLILTLIFFIPAIPGVGFVLALLELTGRRFRTSAGHRKAATAALVVGALSNGLQLIVLVNMLAGRW